MPLGRVTPKCRFVDPARHETWHKSEGVGREIFGRPTAALSWSGHCGAPGKKGVRFVLYERVDDQYKKDDWKGRYYTGDYVCELPNIGGGFTQRKVRAKDWEIAMNKCSAWGRQVAKRLWAKKGFR